MRLPTIPEVVMALHDAPIDPNTGNKALYSVNWLADANSMIGERNEDWVRRELDWFIGGSDKLEDMEGPVPKLFEACAGTDILRKVNSAYGYILFNGQENAKPGQVREFLPPTKSLFRLAMDAFFNEGKGTRHAVAIISDRDIHYISTYNGRKDFICTNALNFMIDSDDNLHVMAQMRSMDAVFGYRADWSMWDYTLDYALTVLRTKYPELNRGNITFQVANLHVYPRHFDALAKAADDYSEQLNRRVFSA